MSLDSLLSPASLSRVMNEPGAGALVDQATLADRVAAGDRPDWAAAHWETFRDGVTGDRDGAPFPCYFGSDSVRNGDPLYALVPSITDPNALLRFRDALLEYLDVYRSREGRVSLVAFFRPPDEPWSEADYHEALWHVLEFLHVHDPEPWPDDVPIETDDPNWEFCFGGEPMFPTCRAPFYGDRRPSRHSPVGLEITFQPRALFDGITADTDAGRRAREVIQGRIEAYDGRCPHADLGDWGVEGDREWHQYLFREEPGESPDECPVRFSRTHPKASPRVDPRMASAGAGDDD